MTLAYLVTLVMVFLAIIVLCAVLSCMLHREREQWKINRAIQEYRWKDTDTWVLLAILLLPCLARAVDYDIAYVRAPRYGDTTVTRWPEVKDPITLESGTDLVLLHPDGSQELLVAGGTDGAVIDPSVSLDGQRIYYSVCPNVRLRNTQVGGIPIVGCDIYSMLLSTRQETRLTYQEWTPNTGVANWCPTPVASNVPCNRPGYGVFNLGAHEIAGNRLVFVSSRNGFAPNIAFTHPNLQLHILDLDSGITHWIGAFNIGSALHPFPLQDGTIGFSTMESAHRRDARLWGLWRIYPDGRRFAPLLSAFMGEFASHFSTQLTDGRVVTDMYYNQNRQSFGTFLAFTPLAARQNHPTFGSPQRNDPSNPLIDWGCHFQATGVRQFLRFPFSPYDLYSLTPFANAEDRATACRDSEGRQQGAVTHPSAAPGNTLLLVWSKEGPAKPASNPQVDGGIYLMDASQQITDPGSQLTLILNDSAYNEQQPRAIVPWSAIHGQPSPPILPWRPREDTRLLPGEAAALFGTSSLCWRNTDSEPPAVNYSNQGSSIGKGRYDCDDIDGLRVLAMEATSHVVYGTGGYGSDVSKWFEQAPGFRNERLRILGEIKVKKFEPETQAPILTQNPDGTIEPDTSFLVKIPCDVAVGFQTLDTIGRPLNHSSTWHNFACGSKEVECGGCHAHARVAKPFVSSVASMPTFPITDMVSQTPLLTQNGGTFVVPVPSITYEYTRDIVPIVTRYGLPTTYNAVVARVQALNAHDSPLLADLAAASATPDELLTVTRWISLGAPRDKGGWFLDDNRPALHVTQEGNILYAGASDNASGVDTGTLTVTWNGQPLPMTPGERTTWSAALPGDGKVVASIADYQGNVTIESLIVGTIPVPPPPQPTPDEVRKQALGILYGPMDACGRLEALRVLLEESEGICQP